MSVKKKPVRGSHEERKQYDNASRDPRKKLTAIQEAYCRYKAAPLEDGSERPDYVAYMMASAEHGEGCTKHTAEKKSVYLNRAPKTKRRIQELRDQKFEKLELSAQDVLNHLAKIAFCDPGRVVKVTPDGKVKITAFDELNKDQGPKPGDSTVAITSIKQGANGVEICFDSRFDALIKLGENAGLWPKRVDVTSGGKPIESLTDEERVARIVAIADAARARGAGPASGGTTEGS